MNAKVRAVLDDYGLEAYKTVAEVIEDEDYFLNELDWSNDSLLDLYRKCLEALGV